MNPTLTERLRNLLEDGKPVAIVTDTNVGPLYAESLCQSVPQLTEAPVLTVPAGRKDIESLMDLWRGLSDSGMTRGGVVVTIMAFTRANTSLAGTTNRAAKSSACALIFFK